MYAIEAIFHLSNIPNMMKNSCYSALSIFTGKNESFQEKIWVGNLICQDSTQEHDTPNHKWKYISLSTEFIVKLPHCVHIYKSLIAKFRIEIMYLQNTYLKYKILKVLPAVCYPNKEIQVSQQTKYNKINGLES